MTDDEMLTGEEFLAAYYTPDLVSPELPPRTPAGETQGRLLRAGRTLPRQHDCRPGLPGFHTPDVPAFEDGAVWRCGCGRRWILFVEGSPPFHLGTWRRRYWPWPR